MREVVVYEKVEGLGITRVIPLKLSKEEEEFFKEYLKKHSPKTIHTPPYPPLTIHYMLFFLK